MVEETQTEDLEDSAEKCISFIKRLGGGVVTKSTTGRSKLRYKWPHQPHSGTIGLALTALARHAPGSKNREMLFKSWDIGDSGVLTLTELRQGVAALSAMLNELCPCTGMHAH